VSFVAINLRVASQPVYCCLFRYMNKIMSRHPNSGQNQYIRISNESFDNVATFKYLGTTVPNKNNIQDEIMSRLNMGNACYYSVQYLFVFPSHVKEPKD
jgi:hypothetical protein